jgi:hypothetical protein
VVSCHKPFPPGTSLEPAMIPTAQDSSFRRQYFRVMCDASSTAAFCSEHVECFRCMDSKYLFTPFVTIPMAAYSADIITHFMFHILCVSIHYYYYYYHHHHDEHTSHSIC